MEMKLPTCLLVASCCTCLLRPAIGDGPKLSLEKALPIAQKVAQAQFRDLSSFYLGSGVLKQATERPERAWEFRWVAKSDVADRELVVRVDATTGRATTSTEATLRKQLRDVIIAKIELDDAPLTEAVAELKRVLAKSWPEGPGVFFVLEIGPVDSEHQTTVTMNMENVPFDVLLKYFAMGAHLSYEIGPHGITMRPKTKQNGADRDGTAP